ncbi:transposase domain-containing protein [Gigaspora margarita]|uniref:Transposase domain-containing protein n=1 Tax=Gigaspora margarita TaxID=4874 RepID=A0A8H4A479_GIGMA|nr:transposase domain-containing protein [Gigaspora margarita]
MMFFVLVSSACKYQTVRVNQLSLSSSSVSTPFQTNQGEDGYNRIIDELASINDFNLDSADEQNSIVSEDDYKLLKDQEESLEVQEELIELLGFQEKLIESLEVQEEGEENEENIKFDGILCIDSAAKNSFTLYAHILSFSDDLLALAKVIYRTIDGKLYKSEVQKQSLNSRNILFELNSIEFFASFPVDIMHKLFENIAPAILWYWSDTFFKDNQAANSDYILFNSNWIRIEKIMENNQMNMLLNFGHPLINIK